MLGILDMERIDVFLAKDGAAGDVANRLEVDVAVIRNFLRGYELQLWIFMGYFPGVAGNHFEIPIAAETTAGDRVVVRWIVSV